MTFLKKKFIQPCGQGRVSILFSMSKGIGGRVARAVQKQLQLPPTPKRRRQMRYCVELILFNAWRCHQVQLAHQDKVVVKYSRTKAHYGSNGRYGKGQLSFTVMMKALEMMESAGYIKQGKTRRGHFRRQSFFYPTDTLTAFFTKTAQGAPKVIHYDTEVIRLVDREKREMDYQDDASTRSMRLEVQKLNALNARHSFTLSIPIQEISVICCSPSSTTPAGGQASQTVSSAEIAGRHFVFQDFSKSQTEVRDYQGYFLSTTPHQAFSGKENATSTSTSLSGSTTHTSTRTITSTSTSVPAFVFHAVQPLWNSRALRLTIPINELMPYTRNFSRGRFDMGGRFYCDAQNIPKNLRPYLLVDGGPTVELDYLANHIFMLYGDLGIPLTEDPYLQVALPGVNDERLRRKAVKIAVMIMLNARTRQGATAAIREKVREGELSLGSTLTPEDLVAAIENGHAPLAPYFNSDMGVKLQFRDSQVAAFVFRRFISAGRPIFGLHDGFRVVTRDEALLRQSMIEAFLAGTGVYPIVERK